MIPLSTIDFDVVEARQNGQSTVCGKSFVLIHLSCQIELEEPREVVHHIFSLGPHLSLKLRSIARTC
jgi:hypothetical protein